MRPTHTAEGHVLKGSLLQVLTTSQGTQRHGSCWLVLDEVAEPSQPNTKLANPSGDPSAALAGKSLPGCHVPASTNPPASSPSLCSVAAMFETGLRGRPGSWSEGTCQTAVTDLGAGRAFWVQEPFVK